MIIPPKIVLKTPWKESYNKLRQCIKKQDIILSTKIYIVKAMVFPVVMYGCECWAIKKVEHQRIDTFKFGTGEDS